MERYEQYKDSGIEWLGKIPQEWTVKKLKYQVHVNPLKDAFYKESSEIITFLPMEKVGEDGKIDCSIKKPISELSSGFTFFRRNDVIVAKITPCFENGKGALLDNLDTRFGFGSTEFHVLRAKDGVFNKFLYYITKSEFFMRIGEAFMSGAAGQKRVPTDFISDFPFVSPNYNEQIVITNYLDHKTAEIDALISQKERLLELYEEEKAAIINHAVTKGIDPDVEFVDSSVEWLGEIPKGWDIIRLKYLGKIKYGLGQPPKQKYDGLPIIRATNVFRGEIRDKDLVFVDPADIPYERDPILKVNDIIVVRSGAYTGDSAIVPEKYAGAVAGYDMVFTGNVDAEFISYCLLSSYVLNAQLLLHSLRAAQPHLNREELGETLIAWPRDSHQRKATVRHIKSEVARIDAKISKTRRIIELQKEYRAALISEVVTGKVKVPDLESNEVAQ